MGHARCYRPGWAPGSSGAGTLKAWPGIVVLLGASKVPGGGVSKDTEIGQFSARSRLQVAACNLVRLSGRPPVGGRQPRRCRQKEG